MSDSKRAQEYLIDPLTAAEPSQETGPGTHFGSTFANTTYSSQGTRMTPPGSGKLPDSSSKNPFCSSVAESKASSRASYPSPPNSASRSPTHSKNPFEVSSPPRQRQSLDSPRGSGFRNGEPTRQRGNSLGTRFVGDESNKPLDIIRRESKRANRAPHLKKRHLPGMDVVDRLDDSIPGAAYHHGGPFDATLLARNTSFNSSPLAAVSGTNAEVLAATPRENIMDAVDRHRPLEGVAAIPPGQQDRFGRTYKYKEGENMMVDLGGNYKRWPGMDYHPDDIKGKGEPQFSIDRARKEAKRKEHENTHGEIEMLDVVAPATRNNDAIETDAVTMKPTARTTAAETSNGEFLGSAASGSGSGISDKKHSLGGLKKRIGSLRKRLE